LAQTRQLPGWRAAPGRECRREAADGGRVATALVRRAARGCGGSA